MHSPFKYVGVGTSDSSTSMHVSSAFVSVWQRYGVICIVFVLLVSAVVGGSVSGVVVGTVVVFSGVVGVVVVLFKSSVAFTLCNGKVMN